MLPGWLGRTGESLVVGWVGGVREGATDLAEDLRGRDRVGPGIGILQQQREGFGCVGMRSESVMDN